MPGTKPLWWLIREGKLDEYMRTRSLNDVTSVPTAPSQETVKGAAVSVVQSATLDTYGTAVTNSALPSGLPIADIKSIEYIVASIATETITFEFSATFSDGTSTATPLEKTSTSNETVALTDAEIAGLYDTGKTVTGISVRAKSSINTSTAVLTFNYTLVAHV